VETTGAEWRGAHEKGEWWWWWLGEGVGETISQRTVHTHMPPSKTMGVAPDMVLAMVRVLAVVVPMALSAKAVITLSPRTENRSAAPRWTRITLKPLPGVAWVACVSGGGAWARGVGGRGEKQPGGDQGRGTMRDGDNSGPTKGPGHSLLHQPLLSLK
jgi:hypothetical protein